MIRYAREGQDFLASYPNACLVVITQTWGSTPRNAHAWMLVHEDQILGSIGGGQLEHAAAESARLAKTFEQQTHNLGPRFQQCCGGRVELALWPAPTPNTHRLPNGFDWTPDPDVLRVTAHGGGHVCKALADLIKPLPIDLTVVDERPECRDYTWPAWVRFNLDAPTSTDAVVIMTHDHGLDLALCERYLSEPVGWLGMLGSDSKAASFASALSKKGLAPSALHCPIAPDTHYGKEPGLVALSIAQALMEFRAKP